ncbi:MAG: RNase adapter RapZ [Lentimicrobiaceae bacterium]|nr:RNase adapter RapZ [Lentimicrobiaceae bacterium]
MNEHQQYLKRLFANWANQDVCTIKPLTNAGSDRLYFRITTENGSYIGAYSPNPSETKAFLSFSESFKKAGFPVPEIYKIGDNPNYYLLQDLGDTSLLDFHLQTVGNNNEPSEETKKYYKQALTLLAEFQIEGDKYIDYNYCYPDKVFDTNSMKQDLYYFKYYFLKYHNIPFDENLLHKDFKTLVSFLSRADNNYFMYRDFQARNIMICDSKLYFIDYQGGRKGPLVYDLVSLLYQAKASLPDSFRNELVEHYLSVLSGKINIDKNKFYSEYKLFALIRILQTLGAYGYRGYIQKKTHFMQSIPLALQNLKNYLQNEDFGINIPELKKSLNLLLNLQSEIGSANSSNKLTVEINSFSFKKGLPHDYSGNGGGYVFDCRGLPNPGRYEEYKTLNGLDTGVKEFFANYPEVEEYCQQIVKIIACHIDNYKDRGFTNLQVNFGCTGGQHRSVYIAQKIADYFKADSQIIVKLSHTAQNINK